MNNRSSAAIDRRALVTRHNPVIRRADAATPLSVGNGNFAFTMDVTGLQTFPYLHYEGIPVCTQAQWAWHTLPSATAYRIEDALESFAARGRQVPYLANLKSDAGQWLRINPHRIGLARIGFEFINANGAPSGLIEVDAIEQTLDLWRGVVFSRFTVDGKAVAVWTCCHPELDLLAVDVESELITRGWLKVAIDFPYASGHWRDPEDWTQPQRHTTELLNRDARGITLQRTLDNDRYAVHIGYDPACSFTREEKHKHALTPPKGARRFAFTVAFAPTAFAGPVPDAQQTRAASEAHWSDFWSHGGAVDFSGSRDERAPELERRVVLSQYLTAIQCAGNIPPQETGLTGNSWYGKFHLEMHWWHAMHFALWGRLPLLEKSLGWYHDILPQAQELARLQGYQGARWPKMTGPDGREGTSRIGTFLIWQQPHPIYYAELCYRERPQRAVLEQYAQVVFETAEFMASYPDWEADKQRYVLGPPLIPAQELYDMRTTTNPTFELHYWVWGLKTAQAWRERLGLARVAKWDDVITKLASLPTADGVYQTAEGIWLAADHPTHLAACGMLPPGDRVDVAMMRRTLAKSLKEWDWANCWGWDFPLTAMTAARLGETKTAVDMLLAKASKNRYLPNGHNYQSQHLPLYLPGNGGLLAAVAMMAAGWDGAPDKPNPGFPDDGTWQVRWENLRRMP